MKILVTGAEGSLMQEVIPLLQAQGHEIRAADSFVRYGEIERERNYELMVGDLADPGFADECVRGVDGVIQAAALIYGVGGFNKYPADILAKDVALQQNILWSMQRQGLKRVVYISSSMVYERCRSHPSREEDVDESLIPLTDYGLSKLVGERLARAFAAQYGLEYVIWRPFNIITPHEEGEEEPGMSHVFADFIRRIVVEKLRVLPIIGDGEQIRCFTWIGDVARGIAEHSFGREAANDTFNLGNPEPMTMRELALAIDAAARGAGVLPQDAEPLQFQTVKDFATDVRKRVPSVDKAERVLGWKPQVPVAESIRRCVEAFVSQEAS